MATRSFTLSNGIYREFSHNRYNDACHKAARYARHLHKRLNVFNDVFFEFTTGSTAPERRAMEKMAHRIQHKIPQTEYLTDLLYIKAADIHASLEQGKQADNEIEQFYALADQALQQMGEQPMTDSNHKVPAVSPFHPAGFSKAEAVQALNDIAKLLPLDRWPWYVISGTFLGLHREGGFLAHDYDIDLGINAEDINLDILLQTLRGSDTFMVKKLDRYLEVLRRDDGTRYLKNSPSIIKVVHGNGVEVDFFIHYTEGNCCWHGTVLHRWENTPFDLVSAELEGVTVNAPKDADRYLTENYGDWRTPVKEYDCATGTHNLVVSRNFFALAYFMKVLAWSYENDRKQAEKLSATLERLSILEPGRYGPCLARKF